MSELTEAADAIPQLVPEAEPPVGFEDRVLHRLGADRRRSRRRWVASIAAVAAAAAIVSITVVRVIESGDSTSTVAAAAPSTTLTATPVAVPMELTAAPLPAGWAYVSNGHGVAVTVSYGMASGGYAVQVKSPAGHAETLGTMNVDGNSGSWTGRSRRPIVAGSTISLIDTTGAAICHGTVPTAQ